MLQVNEECAVLRSSLSEVEGECRVARSQCSVLEDQVGQLEQTVQVGAD